MTRLLVICAPGMDWQGFESRARAGDIPRLAALRAAGIAGWLSGAPPGFGPSAAASIASGVQPENHGVWRDEEAWPGGLRPTGKASWRILPVWARLEAAGISTGSVGWPASRPGADWPGLHVDDSFADSTGRDEESWALPLRCAPAGRREALRSRRVHASRITPTMLAPLIPPAALTDRAHQDKVRALSAGMARAATIQSAAAWMLAESGEPAPDAVFIHQPILQQARLAFGASGEAVFDGVIPEAWRFLDGLIGRLADLAGPDRVTVVVSPGWEGSPGVMLAAGASIAPDPAFESAGLLDIAPTVLGLFGLEDTALPGRRLQQIAGSAATRQAPSSRPPRPLMPDPRVLGPLRMLGYRPPRRAPAEWKARGLAELASMMLDRDPAGAVRAADAALALDPDCVVALRVKVRGHVALRQGEPLEDLADRLLRLAPERGWGALAHGARHILAGRLTDASPWLKTAEANPEVATLLTVATLWVAAGRVANAERVFRKVIALDPGNVTAEIGLAIAATGRRDFMTAEAGLHRARKREPGRPAIWLQLAQVYARSGRKAEAARMAETARRAGASWVLADAAAAGRLRA